MGWYKVLLLKFQMSFEKLSISLFIQNLAIRLIKKVTRNRPHQKVSYHEFL